MEKMVFGILLLGFFMIIPFFGIAYFNADFQYPILTMIQLICIIWFGFSFSTFWLLAAPGHVIP